MDQRERIDDGAEVIRAALDAWEANLWVATPGIIQSFDPAKGTCTVQPSIKVRVRKSTGDQVWVSLPLLLDVPIVFPGGGNFVITFPVAQGDEALIIFADRCIDAWWQQGGVQVPVEFRMHDLSDGFAIVGPRSQPRKLAAVSTTTAQVRSLDGTSYIELTAGGAINIVAPGGVHVTGALVASGEGTFNGGHTVSAHTHGGVTTGAGTTGTPTG